MPLVSIILVNYKRPTDTAECIVSLRKSTFRDFEIIVVENGSQDGSEEFLTQRFPDIHLIASETNLGFAEGNNLGIRYALQQNGRYILLLNNDTLVDERMLEVLVETMGQQPTVGILGAKIFYNDRRNILWFAGGEFNRQTATPRHLGIGEVDSGQYNEPRLTDFITGCCLLTRQEVFERIGLLDDQYFAYYEDSDFCFRARRAGYEILYQPRAVLYHKISATSSWDSPTYLYFNLRNKLLFLHKHTSRKERLLSLPTLIHFYSRQFVRLIFKRRDWKSLHAAWMGLVDGIRHFTGSHGQGRAAQVSPIP